MRPDLASRPLAVVTGATRGLGAVLSRFLAGEGYELILSARGHAELRAIADSLRPLGGTVHAVTGDISEGAVRRAIQGIVERRGRLDLLLNNAAILGPQPLPPLVEFPLHDLDRIWAINVVAPLALVQALLPSLKRAHGQVVNISSDAALGGYPGWGGYGASKAALDLISLTLAHELSGLGVSVVSVDPGDMLTPGVQRALSGEELAGRRLPDVTLPFWAWLLHQDPAMVSGHRFRAQAERWEVPS